MSSTVSQAPFRNRSRSSGDSRTGKKPQQTVVKTWAFDSVGTRKYAIQIKRASNGNPCLKIVEGVPVTRLADGSAANGDAANAGGFRKFDITIWSEDFERLFATLDEVRTYMKEHGIKTPEGHKYDPNKPPRKWNGNKNRGQPSKQVQANPT